MRLNFKSLNKKAVKSADSKQLNKLSEEGLNKVVGGVSFSIEAVALGCCRYRYSKTTEVISDSLS